MQERAQRKRGRISRNAMVVIIIQIQALSASPVLCNVCEREREREREKATEGQREAAIDYEAAWVRGRSRSRVTLGDCRLCRSQSAVILMQIRRVRTRMKGCKRHLHLSTAVHDCNVSLQWLTRCQALPLLASLVARS